MRGIWRRRRLSPVLLAIAIWLGLGLAAPVLVHLSTSSLPFRDAVIAAQSSSYSLVKPLEIAGSRAVRIDRGTVQLTDAGGKPVGSQAAATMLMNGTGTILLDGAAIQIAGAAVARTEEILPIAPVAEALATLRAETLILRRSSIAVTLPHGQVETLTGVDATVSLKRKGIAAIRGKGVLRGQRVTFDLSTGLQRDPNQTVPLRAQVRSPLLDLGFDGRMRLADSVQLEGNGDISTPSVRKVASWLGAYWPPGPGLKAVTLKGQLVWDERSAVFKRAVLHADGNEATGALELTLSGARPALGGTLAFGTLDLTAFLRDGDDPVDATSRRWSSLVSSMFSVPLGGLIDADIRLSAVRVVLDGATLGSSAATVALKDGRLLADVAELQIGTGRGALQVRADLTAFKPRLSLRGKLDNVDLSRAIAVAGDRPIFQAPGSIVLDLTASGSTVADLVRSVSGRIVMKSSDAGRLGLDLRRVRSMAADAELIGWTAISRATTLVESAELKLVARDGVLLTEQVDLRTSDGLWTATGLVNLHAGRLDLRLTQVPAAQSVPSLPSVIEIRGPWAHPSIRALSDPGNADAPTDLLEPASDVRTQLLPSRG